MASFFLFPSHDQAVGETFFTSSDIGPVIWFGIIILWIVMAIVMPMYYIVTGLQEEGGHAILNASIGVLIFIFGMALTLKGWFWVTGFAGLSDTPLVTAIFWVGFLLSWISTVFVVPAALIVKAFKDSDLGE